MRYSDWIADVRQLVSNYGIDVDIDAGEAREHWRVGSSPENYFDACIVFEKKDEDFDLRYDL